MRDDTNERDALLNHAHPGGPAGSSERDELPTELVATHEALTQLATRWSATTSSAERLAAFTRQLPERPPVAAHDATASLRERPRMRSDVGASHPTRGGGRLLAGLMAAAIIVSLLAATLLKLAPGRTARGAQMTPIVAVSTPTAAARLAEEPAQQPPSGAWATAAQTQLIPAPSDGQVIYQVEGADARASGDGGATWRDLTLPAFSHTHVTSENASLAVSDADPRLVLLSVTLAIDSANPENCPQGSTNSDSVAMHGGILASGYVTCQAHFVSHDGGGSWASAHTFYTAFGQPTVWQVSDTLYGVRDDVDRSPQVAFPLVGLRLMASHDQGVSWGYADTTLRLPSRYVCSYLPSSADGALYAVTSAAPCYSAGAGAHTHTVWRSADGGATWRQLSTVNGLSITLIASTPTASGRGLWIYMLKDDAPISSPDTLLVSQDGGVSWSQTAPLSQAGRTPFIRPVDDTLSDGSLVVAVIAQQGVQGQTPGKATFYAWRPGDSTWRPLTTPLEAYYDNYFFGLTLIVIAHGARNAIDTLSVMEKSALAAAGPYTTHTYLIR